MVFPSIKKVRWVKEKALNSLQGLLQFPSRVSTAGWLQHRFDAMPVAHSLALRSSRSADSTRPRTQKNQ
jgi:hypothetical protein